MDISIFLGNVTQIMLTDSWRNFEQRLEFQTQKVVEANVKFISILCIFILLKVLFPFDGIVAVFLVINKQFFQSHVTYILSYDVV